LSVLPALKAGTLEAAILISSFVRGLRPVRAARLRTVKVPKPTTDTSLLERFLHGLEESFERAACIGLGQFSMFGHGIDQIGFIH
jgi:hypothetical protein